MDPLLPLGARLLHIGPPKTGTTTLQSAFHHNRAELLRHGVHYAGRARQARAAATAVATGGHLAGLPEGSVDEWPRLVREVQRSRADRVVISSETFARCDDAAAARVIEAFDPERTHIVLTMRPLADMLASSWQQYVQGGMRASYDTWLRSELEAGAKPLTPTFWPRTRIDDLARRWSALVGPEHVTVVSLAAQPREFVLRTFESLVGVPAGSLQPDPHDENPSLPFPVVETLRHFNRFYATDRERSSDQRARMVEFGALQGLRALDAAHLHAAPTATPAWAVARATEVAAEMVAGVREQGVRVIGDLDALAGARPAGSGAQAAAAVSPEDAGALVYSMMVAARTEASRSTDLEWLGTADLLRTAAARLRDRAGGRLRLRLAGSPLLRHRGR